jgi:cytochrome c oxidase subunit 2
MTPERLVMMPAMVTPDGRSRLSPAARLRRAGALAILAILSASCSFIEVDSPLTTFEPAGPFARRIDALFWPVFWIATGIFVVVQTLIFIAIFVYRDRLGAKEPKQIHGNPILEVTWTVIPTLILAGIAVPTVQAVFDLTECGSGAMDVEVVGHQWWFEYHYPDLGITTANVLVMPEDVEVCARMTSDDVLHNFWIPSLNGKRYLVPGQETLLRLQADEPGEYWGHCAEFCGLSHSLMRARAKVVTAADFDTWTAEQQTPAAVPAEGTPAAKGWEIYQAKCTGCHGVSYAGADGATAYLGPAEDAFNGPNLTHFASRAVFAGASLPDEDITYEAALTEWLANPPGVKPGSFMPNLGLTQDEITALIAWLETMQ